MRRAAVAVLFLFSLTARAEPMEPGYQPEAPYTSAQTLLGEGAPKEALAAIDSYKAKGKAEASRLFLRARILRQLDRLDDAIKTLDKAKGLNPDLLVATYNQGCYAALKGDKKLALAKLRDFYFAVAKSTTFKPARALEYVGNLDEDVDLASLRGDPAFEPIRAAAWGAATKLVEAAGAVCVGDPFAKKPPPGRCAPKPACPAGFVLVRRAKPVAAKDKCG